MYVSTTAGNARGPSADVNRLRRSSPIDDTSTLNCSANSTSNRLRLVGRTVDGDFGGQRRQRQRLGAGLSHQRVDSAVFRRCEGHKSAEFAVQRIVHRRIIAPG